MDAPISVVPVESTVAPVRLLVMVMSQPLTEFSPLVLRTSLGSASGIRAGVLVVLFPLTRLLTMFANGTPANPASGFRVPVSVSRTRVFTVRASGLTVSWVIPLH